MPRSNSNKNDPWTTPLVILASSLLGATVTWVFHRQEQQRQQQQQRPNDPETDHAVGHGLVWNSINGAMNAAMMYVGDHLKLYEELRELCAEPGSFTTAVELAEKTVRTCGGRSHNTILYIFHVMELNTTKCVLKRTI